MEAILVVVGSADPPRQYALELPAVIGRSRTNDLTLGHPLVSRHHCEVFEANGMLMVRDLGSLNGTFVGDLRIAEQAMPVKPGDLITIGPVTFRADYAQGGTKRSHQSTWKPIPPTNRVKRTFDGAQLPEDDSSLDELADSKDESLGEE